MSNCKRFILLGDAGAGKSSFINLLYNTFYGTTKTDEIFCEHPRVRLSIPCANWLDCLDKTYKNKHSERDINDQTQSQTRACTNYIFEKDDIRLEIIDTPGFNDTNGIDMDEQNLSYIETALKEKSFLSGIILVVNGANSRIGTSFRHFLHLLHQVWPNDLLNNCIAVLTNCDELSVNLDPSIVHRDLHVHDGRIFHLQNSLFRWDRKNYASKTIRRFQQDFEDNMEIIEKIMKTLLQFNNVSTDAFQVGAIKILAIERSICDSINDMIQLFTAFKEQQVAEVSIEAAQHTMQSNKQRDKQLEINAIRWVEAPQYQSPSASAQLNQKFTRDTFLKDQSKTFESTDRQLHKSKSSDQNQEKHHSFSSNCDRLSTKNHASIDIERKRSQQSTHGSRFYSEYDNEKQSSSQSTSSRKTNNEQLSKAIDSSRGSTFHSTTASDGFQYAKGTAEKYHKDNLSSSSANHNKQHDSCLALSPMKVSDCSHSYEISRNTPTYRQEQTKIQVTIPDNEARFYHDSAQRQESSLSERKQDLICQQRTLAHSLKSLRDNLKKEVTHLRSINKNYDLVERNRELLLAFKEVMQVLGGDPQMQHYYDDTLNILSNK